ncbi:MAG: phosphoenolpyruvate--protein phosphotransferase [Alphaproteobacteria bacterium]|nr:phosphoenolpyruvate--protein phosphotransferase [Alphaproteobacteria bacterium]
MSQAGLGPGGARRLLKRLRDLMAGAGTAQERLNQIVRLIAADMVAEVCSVYMVRPGDVLELFATEGLKQEAVHKTRLAIGEGLVGDIAAHSRPLALADAQSHPNFAYKPETGEEIFHSLMGVPILRGGRVLGVLAVQNRSFREYDEEEVETLQTIAMVVAELASVDSFVGPEDVQLENAALLPERFEGLRLNEGLAMGRVVFHQPRVSIRQMVAEDPARERSRLDEAVERMHRAIDDLLNRADLGHAGEHREILETYRMFAEDRGWLGRIVEAINTGLTAEAAVQRVQDDTRARMSQVTDPYLRERLSDLEDLGNRLLRHLTGDRTAAQSGGLPDEAVLIARNMGPAELLDYDRTKLRAVVMEEGSPTAHVAIVARALGIPMVGRVKDVLSRTGAGEPIIVDGEQGAVVVRPSEDVREAFVAALNDRAARQAQFAQIRDLPAVSRDGVAVELLINAGLLIDLGHLESTGAKGVGLYRTEIPFMIRSAFPDVPAQIEFYRDVYGRAGERPVVFRTLDVGGDKRLPYLEMADDENPAMGWRAIRIALDRPMMLRYQLRALLVASGGRPLDVMFPMVADVSEFDAARDLLDREIARLREQGGVPPSVIRVGTMLEVPALYWQLPALLSRVDFISVGSNDLMQFLFACDRGSTRLSGRYDTLSPIALRFLGDIVDACTARGVTLTLCGEMAGRPLEAMALIGLGFRRLSMSPGAIGPVKAMIRSADVAALAGFTRGLTTLPDHAVRGRLAAFARDRGIAV